MGDEFYVLRQGEASVTVHTDKGDKALKPREIHGIWPNLAEIASKSPRNHLNSWRYDRRWWGA